MKCNNQCLVVCEESEVVQHRRLPEDKSIRFQIRADLAFSAFCCAHDNGPQAKPSSAQPVSGVRLHATIRKVDASCCKPRSSTTYADHEGSTDEDEPDISGHISQEATHCIRYWEHRVRSFYICHCNDSNPSKSPYSRCNEMSLLLNPLLWRPNITICCANQQLNYNASVRANIAENKDA